MPKRRFSVDDLHEMDLYEDSDGVKFYEGSGARRWSETFEVVFTAEDDGKDYLVHVEEGLTEYQEYSGDERFPNRERDEEGRWWVSCPEVETYQVMKPVTKWRKV